MEERTTTTRTKKEELSLLSIENQDEASNLRRYAHGDHYAFQVAMRGSASFQCGPRAVHGIVQMQSCGSSGPMLPMRSCGCTFHLKLTKTVCHLDSKRRMKADR